MASRAMVLSGVNVRRVGEVRGRMHACNEKRAAGERQAMRKRQAGVQRGDASRRGKQRCGWEA